MANLTITAANVGCGDDSFFRRVQAGVAVTHAQPAYQQSNGKWYLGDANGSADTADVGGITFCSAALDGEVLMLVGGELKLGAILTQGTTYVVSRTAGLICPLGDLVSGDYVTILGVAKDSSTLIVDIRPSGIVI